MSLTPMEIHNKDFPRKFRGYDPDEVDQFLDTVVEDFEKLYKENIDIKEKLRGAKERIDSYKAIEDTLKETLVTAQKTADEVVSAAQRKAELTIRESEAEAARILQQGNEKLDALKKVQEEYQKRADMSKIKFRKLLEAEIELLSDKDMIG